MKEYFPEVAERLKMKINLTQNFTTIVTGHGKTRSYLQRFKIIETPTCFCGTRDQTTDHLLFEYIHSYIRTYVHTIISTNERHCK
jgi:hypothetical protein